MKKAYLNYNPDTHRDFSKGYNDPNIIKDFGEEAARRVREEIEGRSYEHLVILGVDGSSCTLGAAVVSFLGESLFPRLIVRSKPIFYKAECEPCCDKERIFFEESFVVMADDCVHNGWAFEFASTYIQRPLDMAIFIDFTGFGSCYHENRNFLYQFARKIYVLREIA